MCYTHDGYRADLRESRHIVWAMVARRRAAKAMIIGWRLIAAVCPHMAPRNICTCRTGDHEIRDGDDVLLHDGQSVHTLIERRSQIPEDHLQRILVLTSILLRNDAMESMMTVIQLEGTRMMGERILVLLNCLHPLLCPVAAQQRSFV